MNQTKQSEEHFLTDLLPSQDIPFINGLISDSSIVALDSPYNLLTPGYSDNTAFQSHDTASAGENGLLAQFTLQTPLHTPTYCTTISYDEFEEFLTPRVSPAIPPNHSELFQCSSNEQYFTRQSSPSIFPDTSIPRHTLIGNNTLSETKFIYRKNPLGSGRCTPPPPPLSSPLPASKKRPSLRQQIALASPKLPATPASLMKISSHPSTSTIPPDDIALPPSQQPKKRKIAPSTPLSPRTLRPVISPFLQPEFKSMTSVLTPDVENRRSAHKVAEQRRRDTLKQSFDALREEIVDVLIQDTGRPVDQVRQEKEKEVKLMSKVMLVQHSYDYIVRLKKDAYIKDEKIKRMQEEIKKLKDMLSS